MHLNSYYSNHSRKNETKVDINLFWYLEVVGYFVRCSLGLAMNNTKFSSEQYERAG